MGIKKLTKYLIQDNIVQPIHFKQLAYKKIAIDISILLYQIMISYRNNGDDLKNSSGKVISHTLGIFNKTVWLISNNIIPIYIFDGKPPEFKQDILNNRRKIKELNLKKLEECETEEDKIKYLKRTVSITEEYINETKEILDLMGIPYIQASGEADILCAKLSEDNIVDYVYTEDMDIFTFGASKIIKNLFTKKQTYLIDKLQILKKYDITIKQFTIMCILLGCDYHTINFKLTKDEAINLSKEYIMFKSIYYNNKKLNKYTIEKIYNYFNIDIDIDKYFDYIKFKSTNDDIINILKTKYEFNIEKITWKINILNKNKKYLSNILI